MKFKGLAFFTFFVLSVQFTVYAQCDYRIKVTSTLSADSKGEISATLSNAGSYRYVLYSYVEGNKKVFMEKSGRANQILIRELPNEGYYRLVVYFKNEDIKCSSWASELINLED